MLAPTRVLRLQNGVYLQLHAYMFRVAIPYGTLPPASPVASRKPVSLPRLADCRCKFWRLLRSAQRSSGRPARGAAERTATAHHLPRTVILRLSLRLHYRICSNCRRFARQVELMRTASARWRARPRGCC